MSREPAEPAGRAELARGAFSLRTQVIAACAVLAVCGLLGAYGWTHFKVTNDIAHFLPDGQDAVTGRVLRALATSGLGQRMVLTLGGAKPEQLRAGSELIAKQLQASQDISEVQWSVDEAAQKAIYDLYFPRRYAFWSEQPERDYSAMLSDVGLQRSADRLLTKLGGPEGALIRRMAPEDPLLAFPRVLERLDAARQGGLRVRDGAFFSPDERYAVLFVQTHAPALDATAQRRVLTQIDAALEHARAALHVPFTLEKTGVGRYSVRAETAIRADVERISTLSTALLVALLLIVLRSFSAIVLTIVPSLIGALAASAVTLLVFGRLHGMTLAFGTTLIGVCSDYPVHLLSHHLLGPKGLNARKTVENVWPALRLGGLTTVAGMVGLGFAPFAGIRELALFSSVGVLASLFATRWSIPWFMGISGRGAPSQRALATQLGRAVGGLRERPKLSCALLAFALAVCAAGAFTLRFDDDLASWVPAPKDLREEDARVSQRLLAMDVGRMVVVSAPTLEQALQRNDQVAALLTKAATRGEVGGFKSLHALLWSEALQRQNVAALRAASDVSARASKAFETAGFEPEAIAPFARSLDREIAPLELADLLASPLAPIAGGFILETEPSYLIATHLRDVRDPAALVAALTSIPEARYFDQRELLTTTYAAFRARTLELVAAGLLAVFVMVLARYRAPRKALAAVAPAVLAAFSALSILSLCGVRLDLFHALGVLLVLSMGEDYGVFLVESEGTEGLAATVLGIVVACASTVISFGLLAMSTIPALRSLGQIVSLGVLLSMLFAPAGLTLLPRATRVDRGVA